MRTPRPDASARPFEIYGVGESTMVGQPYAARISIPLLLDYMFDGRIDGREIVVKNLAESSVPTYSQAIAFELVMAARGERVPGVVLIISGHNPLPAVCDRR